MQPQLLDLFVTPQIFANFIPLGNEPVIAILQTQSSQFSHLVGPAYSGKTHLLKAWVTQAHKQGRTAVFLDSHTFTHNIRSLAEKFSFIALDNIEHLNGQQQIALFDLFNTIKLNNRDNFLLTSCKINLNIFHTLRDDLKTRILSGLNMSLKSLDDEALHHALTIFTTKEGIRLDMHEQNYLISHHTRNIGVLIQTIHKLAEVAVLEKRNITIPLIKHVLQSV